MLPAKVKPGEVLKADTINKLIDEVYRLSKISGGKGIGVTKSGNGYSIYLRGEADGGSGSLPVGQYVGMVWETVSNNVSAMAYPVAVATV